MPVFEGLGKALRWLREKQGKRQYELADEARVTKAMLSAYETGKQRPSLETLEKILDGLGADLAALDDALDLVNERPRALSAPVAREGEVDVRALLGVESLPREEEAALGQMVEGFHRFLRYLHRTRSDEGPPGAGN